MATGASQFALFDAIRQASDVEWDRVTAFHLDEYCGISSNHRASFRKYLKERFADSLTPTLYAMHYIDGKADSEAECSRVGKLLREAPIDVAFVGIGENAHLAFNDPPADFETNVPYLVVDLDPECRLQQVNEGWFKTIDEVPKQAILMSIQQIEKSGDHHLGSWSA